MDLNTFSIHYTEISDLLKKEAPELFNINHTAAAMLSDTKVCVAYSDVSNIGCGVAIIADISSEKIKFGAGYYFSTRGTDDISIVVLSDDKICITYRDSDHYNHGVAIIGDISGTVITFGAQYAFSATNSYYISVSKLTDTRVYITYIDGDNYNCGEVVIGDVSGNVITFE